MGDQIRVAVVGASGYSGQELLRYLLLHPQVDLVCVTSRQYAGQGLGEVFPRFRGVSPASRLPFSEAEVGAVVASGARFVFLALPHGLAAEFAVPLLDAGLRVIDLSADFRLRDAGVYAEFYGVAHPAPGLLGRAVYGLPEVYADAIAAAELVASPGCYPTSIILPLLPLLRGGLIDATTIAVASMSGVSGAGRSASVPLLFAECEGSVRAYGLPRHRHLSEIEQELGAARGGPVMITFTPHLVPIGAGICTTTVASLDGGGDAGTVSACLEEAYGAEPLVRLLGVGGCPDTKNVRGTAFIDIGFVVDERTGRLVLLSAEDNLGKGASAQAIQSLNLMAGLPPTTGLVVF
ncbi:N-acetyl-gamma-glutamyl-phosphate reductase [soil metagenome]